MDTPAPRFVRQYALTKGRARASTNWPLDTLVNATPLGRSRYPGLSGEAATIIALTSSAQLSIAEIGAHLHVHLGIARVLVGDLVDAGLVNIVTPEFSDDGPDLQTLERLLYELQAT